MAQLRLRKWLRHDIWQRPKKNIGQKPIQEDLSLSIDWFSATMKTPHEDMGVYISESGESLPLLRSNDSVAEVQQAGAP